MARAILATIALTLFTPNLHALTCTDQAMVIAFNGDWKPYFFKDEKGSYGGRDYQKLVQILTQLHCDVDVLPMPRNRTLIESEKGTFDLFLGASYTEERNQRYYFSQPYRSEIVGFATLNTTATASQNLQSIVLSGGSIGINIHGYFGANIESLKKRFPGQFIHQFGQDERLQLLLSGEVAAIVDDKTALCIQAEANRGQEQDMIVNDADLHIDTIHFMFNRQTTTEQFVERFNALLSAQNLVQQQHERRNNALNCE